MAYILSLGAGLIVGVLYALVGIRSPAPPLVALIGLLGMVLGESGIMLLKQRATRAAPPAAERNAPDAGTVGR